MSTERARILFCHDLTDPKSAITTLGSVEIETDARNVTLHWAPPAEFYAGLNHLTRHLLDALPTFLVDWVRQGGIRGAAHALQHTSISLAETV